LSQSKDYEEELFKIDQKLKKYENTKITQEKHINKLKELNQIYSKYIESCAKLGVYDFADMIEFVLKEFKKDENLRYYYAELYQFIMVDEYQDTNNTQNEIVDIIMSVNDDKNILVV
jgi:DNA helicase II / ATP-dependent DNA helicase PcrA